jgi:hypothetical protein
MNECTAVIEFGSARPTISLSWIETLLSKNHLTPLSVFVRYNWPLLNQSFRRILVLYIARRYCKTVGKHPILY